MKHGRHTTRRRRLAAATAWCVAIAGFVVYLASLSSFMDAYGGVGTGVVLLLWVTLFSVLYYATPDLRRPRRLSLQRPVGDVDHARPSALVERVERVVAPSAALRNPAAQGRMMSVLGTRAGGMSEREIDLMDWGFAFGVAWAIARSQDPAATEELVSERALHTTQAVYLAYRGSTTPRHSATRAPMPNGAGHGPPEGSSAAHAHAHRP